MRSTPALPVVTVPPLSERTIRESFLTRGRRKGNDCDATAES